MMGEPRGRKGAWGDQKGPRMDEDVGSRSSRETMLWAISSTRLEGVLVCEGIVCGRECARDLRLEPENVGHPQGLIADLGGGLPDAVDKVHADHPLINCQLNLSREVVDVPDQGAQHDPVARRYVGAHGVEDVLGEVRVESVRCAIGAVGTVRTVGCHGDEVPGGVTWTSQMLDGERVCESGGNMMSPGNKSLGHVTMVEDAR